VKIHVLPSGPLGTNGYLLVEPARGEAVLVDAPQGVTDLVRPILERAKCRLVALWLTHGHFDHMQDAARLKREQAPEIVAHRADQGLVETPEIMEGFMGAKLGLVGVKVDRWVADGDRIEALGRSFEVRHVPGHCPGNILFHLAPETADGAGVALVGDALFAGGVGRWDLPGGSFDELARSIRGRIYTLPDDTVVLSGHGPRTTVGAEKAGNPYIPA
jgi:hydroxyacylglutathione hydrolase